MGLAPYGEPVYVDLINRYLIDIKDDGSFRMDMAYFRYCQGLVMTSPEICSSFSVVLHGSRKALLRNVKWIWQPLFKK